MLPYPRDVIPVPAKLSPKAIIPAAGTLDLCAPVLGSSLGEAHMPRAAVPKATIDKHDKLLIWKIEIWFARQFWMFFPAKHSRIDQGCLNPALSGAVSSAADLRHESRALCFA